MSPSTPDVFALLNQLRASQALQTALASHQQGSSGTEPSEIIDPGPSTGTSTDISTSASGPSVASLLAQLQPAIDSDPSSSVHDHTPTPYYPPSHRDPGTPLDFDQHIASDSNSYDHPTHYHVSFPSIPPTAASALPHQPPSVAQRGPGSFQNALLAISSLSEDPSFVGAIKDLCAAQENLEKDLWAERIDIRKKHEQKVQVAKKKADMIGVSISTHEAKMMQDAFTKDIRRFDLQRVLPAWDSHVAHQQTTLQTLGVPVMMETDEPSIRKTQQRVIQVLEGLSSSIEDC